MRFVLLSFLAARLAYALPASRDANVQRRAAPQNFTLSGGVGVRPTDPKPIYEPFSEFDFQSLNLALNQEFIELDLFHKGLAQFSVEEFAEAGLNGDDLFLIQFMADQEVSHAELISNMLGRESCRYWLSMGY